MTSDSGSIVLDLVKTHRVGSVKGEYPFLGPESDLQLSSDWIGQVEPHYNQGAAWGLYQSGQFVYLSKYPTDGDNGVFPVVPAIYDLTGFFGFASNLLGGICDENESCVVEIVAHRLAGRTLFAPGRRLKGRTTRMETFNDRVTAAVGQFREEVVEAAEIVLVRLFERFKWNTAVDYVNRIQQEFLAVLPP